MKMKKRFLSILLSLAMVLGLMPGMNLTAYADSGSLMIMDNTCIDNGAEKETEIATVKSYGVESVTYNSGSDTGEITFNNAALTPASGHTIHADNLPISIVLKGTSSITSANDHYPIYTVSSGVSISGSGQLTLDGNNSAGYDGIDSAGPVNISGGATVNVTKIAGTGIKSHGGFTISGATVNTSGNTGIEEGNDESSITITGSKVTVSGNSCGIDAASGDGSVTITNSSVIASAPNGSAIKGSLTTDKAGAGWKTVGADGKPTGDPETITAGTHTADSISAYWYIQIPYSDSAPATAAKVTANNRTYDGTEKPLVTVDNSTLVGGEMQYALGDNATTAPADNLYTTSIPAKTEVGTYYVWYKAVGDATHSDTAPVCISVTIKAAPALTATPNVAPTAAPTEVPAPELPKTGDTTDLVLWLLLTVLGLGAAAILLRSIARKGSR